MKAVLFDIYETLITAKPQSAAERSSALTEVTERHHLDPKLPLEKLFASAVQKAHQISPFPYPEVDVREIWKSILPSTVDHENFAADYEEAVHPTLPVAGAQEMILKLHREQVLLGLISNAQAYTHELLQHHLGEAASCFDPSLCVFSYRLLRAKPDPHLFQLAIAPLLERDFQPNEILMIGDSPRNDIDPARGLGLQTHLIELGILSIPRI